MNIIKFFFLLFLIFTDSSLGYSQKIRVHDPVMIKEGSTYYLFCTGMGISVFSSSDMENWQKEKSVFDTPPQWAVEAVPGFEGHIWAPDISFHNGQYYLYYSVSAFGKNTSCIGLATNKTLDPENPHYRWTDHEKIIQSVPGRDLWNAIDPNLILDENNVPWLAFGSFWSGMKLVKLNENLKQVAEPQVWHTISKRERSYKTDDYDPGPGAVEAPFVFRKNNYYYLFVSFDFCCRGAKSNYKVMVGRSPRVIGPYVDKEGNRLDQGGGSLVLQGNQAWYGVGHNSAYTFDGKDYLVLHGYDASDEGRPKLLIRQIKWDNEGWPEVGL